MPVAQVHTLITASVDQATGVDYSLLRLQC